MQCPNCKVGNIYARGDLKWKDTGRGEGYWVVSAIENQLDCTDCDHAWSLRDWQSFDEQEETPPRPQGAFIVASMDTAESDSFSIHEDYRDALGMYEQALADNKTSTACIAQIIDSTEPHHGAIPLHKLDIEWTGQSMTDQIDQLEEAYAAAQAVLDKYGYEARTVYALVTADAECGQSGGPTLLWSDVQAAFARVAFKGWIQEPDTWTLTA